MVSELARSCECEFIHPDYRLAPENRFPSALEDALAVYSSICLNDQPAADIIVGGDSAGGGLALALLLAAQEEGLPMPRCVVLYSPWVDLLHQGQSLGSNACSDPLVSLQSCIAFSEMYAPKFLHASELVSPLMGDLRRLPQTLIQVGSGETLFSDSERLHAKMVAQGVGARMEIWENQIHVWQMHYKHLPQARSAIRRTSEFVQKSIR